MAVDRMKWEGLRVFLILAETGSISGAARRMGDSPPTVARKLDELESALNAALFTRTTKGIEITESGRKALRYARTMSEAAEALHEHVSDADTVAEGPVRLVTGDGIGPHWIAPHLPGFHLANPRIQLQMTVTDEPPDLLAGEADISVQFAEPRHADLIAKKMGTVHYMCFASQPYIDTYGEPKSIFEFPDHRCIFHQGYVNQTDQWPLKVLDFSKLLDFALVTNSGTTMMAVCAGGGGIAVLPSFAAALDERLVPLALSEVMPAQFWVTYTERARRLQRGQVVLDWLRTLFDERKHLWFRSTFHHPKNIEPADFTAPPREAIVSHEQEYAET